MMEEFIGSFQIELDLLRTFPTNRYFKEFSSEVSALSDVMLPNFLIIFIQAIIKLRRVLVAFSWHNPNVGYCQGLNMMAALITLHLNEESHSFNTCAPTHVSICCVGGFLLVLCCRSRAHSAQDLLQQHDDGRTGRSTRTHWFVTVVNSILHDLGIIVPLLFSCSALDDRARR